MDRSILLKIIIAINTLLIIIFAYLGIFTLTVRYQLLNPDYYKKAFSESGIYQQLELVAEDYVHYLIIQTGENVSNTLVNNFIDDSTEFNKFLKTILINSSSQIIEEQSRGLASSIVSKLEVSSNVEAVTESYINNHIKWITGDTYEPAYFKYIPDKTDIETYGDQIIIENLIVQLIREFGGVNQLPSCETPAEETKALELVTAGKSDQIGCTNSNIDLFLNQEFEQYVPSRLISGFVTIMNEKAADSEDTALSGVYDSIITLFTGLSEYKELMKEMKYYYGVMLSLGIFLVSLALMILILNIVLLKTSRLSYTLLVTGTIGLLITLSVALYQNQVIGLVYNPYFTMNLDLSNEIIPESRSILLNQSINSIGRLLAYHIFDYTYQVGAIMMIIGFFGYFGKYVYSKIYEKQHVKNSDESDKSEMKGESEGKESKNDDSEEALVIDDKSNDKDNKTNEKSIETDNSNKKSNKKGRGRPRKRNRN